MSARTRRPREILMAHGSGGRLTQDLVREIFLSRLNNSALAPLEDAACLTIGGERLAFTTDSFVVTPIVFPGGDLGKLAVCGTVNDLAVMGARPVALSAGFVMEEGLPFATIERLVDSMALACKEAGVAIVTGDTKVVERGACDQVFINTAGIGALDGPLPEGGQCVRAGDRVLISGPIADHGTAVLSARNDLRFESTIESDCAQVWGLVRDLLQAVSGVRWMRDPTRGGVATVLNELVAGRSIGIELLEEAIPVRAGVRALTDILGLDPLYVASEGRVVVVVDQASAGPALNALRAHPQGRYAAEIGRVVDEAAGTLVLRTRVGGRRILDLLSGEQLPRIC